MKRLVVFLAVFLSMGGALAVYAQDLLILKDGSVIEAKVTEISASEIRYKRSNHLDGPTIVVAVPNVLSIRYANGKVDIISANPAVGANPAPPAPVSQVAAAPVSAPPAAPPVTAPVSQVAAVPVSAQSASGTTPQLGLPITLQSILNSLPAIPIAGNNLKFDFSGESWTARLNGENFSTGTIEFGATAAGGILTLRQTHIWPGAAGKTAGRLASMIPGGGAVGSALNTAGNVAGALGPIEASGTTVLEYKAGPPASLRSLSKKEQKAVTKQAAAKQQPPAAPTAAPPVTAPVSQVAAVPVSAQFAPGTAPQLGLPIALQSILNSLPAIPIAGNNLKFDFSGESWTARLNGENFSTGTIEFGATAAGGILTLRQTHIWPGAAGKTAGRLASMIPGGGAVGSALNTAGNVAGALGPIEASGTILLEYKAGPPASLRSLSKKEQKAVTKQATAKQQPPAAPSAPGIQSTAGIQSFSAIVLSDDIGWWLRKDPKSIAQMNISTETIDGQERGVLALKININDGGGWAGAVIADDTISQQLRGASGIRFKALGDGKTWALAFPMPETSTDGGSHRADIKTKKGIVVEVDIPFSKLKQPEWGKRVGFNKDSIIGMLIERSGPNAVGAATLKVFDIEVY